MPSELDLSLILCTMLLGGAPEARTDYVVSGEARHIRIDCETDSAVIEVGLDGKRGSIDSVHQAVFAAELTGKRPVVVIVDTDGYEGHFEYQIERVAHAMGVEFRSYDLDLLRRWQMTHLFRERRAAVQAQFPAAPLSN